MFSSFWKGKLFSRRSRNCYVVELTDVPECCPGASLAYVTAYESKVVITYEINDRVTGGQPAWAVVRCDGCICVQTGMPNDEAFHNHPLFSVGLQHYAMQKIVNSPWIRERAAIAHKEGDPDWMMIDRHHFLFAFKENYVECVAKSCTSLGTFPSLENAVAHSNSVLLAI